MKAGAENGERGYQLTFAIAYIRDFMMDHWVIGGVVRDVGAVERGARARATNVKQRLWQEHAQARAARASRSSAAA